MPKPPEDTTASADPSDRDRLESWKEIAAHLGREVRTVQRWEKYEGLPVRRHGHEQRGSVFAYREEIEQWRAGRQNQATAGNGHSVRVRSAAYVYGLAALVVMIGAGWSLYVRGRGDSPVPLAAPASMGRLFASSTGEGEAFHLIPVGRHPTSLAISPDGAEVWVAAEATLNVIHTVSATMTHAIPVRGQMRALAFSKDGRRVYAGNEEGELVVIDARSKSVLRTLGLGSVTSLALTPDGRFLYLGGTFRPLKKLDTTTGAISDVLTASCPVHVAVSPDGHYLFINYQCFGPSGRRGHDSIEVRALPSEKVVKTIDGLRNVGGAMAVSPDGEHLWASGEACVQPSTAAECKGSETTVLNVIRRSDWNAIRAIRTNGRGGIAFSPDGSRVIFGGEVFNSNTYRVVESVASNWSNLVVTPDRRRAFAASMEWDAVAVFDLKRPSCVRPVGLTHLWAGDGSGNDVAGGDDTHWQGMEFAAGKVGQAFAFTGGEPFFRVPSLSYVAGSQGEVTFAAWIKAAAAEGDMSILGVAGRKGAGWWLTRMADGRALSCLPAPCAAGSGGALVSASQLVPGRWHHVALRVMLKPDGDGYDTALFLDGRVEDRSRIASVEGFQRPPGAGRSRPGGEAFRGLLDEVALFSRALDDGQIRRLATDLAPLECVPLVTPPPEP